MSEGMVSGLPVAEISYYDATVAKRLMEENTNLRRENSSLRKTAELVGEMHNLLKETVPHLYKDVNYPERTKLRKRIEQLLADIQKAKGGLT